MARISQYKGVYLYAGNTKDNVPKWIAKVQRKNVEWSSKPFNTEREAAIAYDKKLIELREQPINILRKL